MRSNGREPLRTSQTAPTRVSLHAGERPQVACSICGSWRWLKRGMLRPHRADDQITRCPGSGQQVVVDERPEQWRDRLGKAVEASIAGGHGPAYTRKALEPLSGHNGRPRLLTSKTDPRRVSLVGPDACRLACPLCGRWREVDGLPPGRLGGDGVLGAHRADDGVTRCPGSGQRVLVDETRDEWLDRLHHTQREASRIATAVAALQAGELDAELDLGIEFSDIPIALREELAGV